MGTEWRGGERRRHLIDFQVRGGRRQRRPTFITAVAHWVWTLGEGSGRAGCTLGSSESPKVPFCIGPWPRLRRRGSSRKHFCGQRVMFLELNLTDAATFNSARFRMRRKPTKIECVLSGASTEVATNLTGQKPHKSSDRRQFSAGFSHDFIDII